MIRLRTVELLARHHGIHQSATMEEFANACGLGCQVHDCGRENPCWFLPAPSSRQAGNL
jgi:hypothetical protein